LKKCLHDRCEAVKLQLTPTPSSVVWQPCIKKHINSLKGVETSNTKLQK